MVQIGHSGPQDCRKKSTTPYRGFPPCTIFPIQISEKYSAAMHYELHSLQLCRQKSPYERYDTPEDLYYHKREKSKGEKFIARQFEIRSMINCWCETLPVSPAGSRQVPSLLPPSYILGSPLPPELAQWKSLRYQWIYQRTP